MLTILNQRRNFIVIGATVTRPRAQLKHLLHLGMTRAKPLKNLFAGKKK